MSPSRALSADGVNIAGSSTAVGEKAVVSMFVGRINGEGAGVSITIGLTGDAGLAVHAAITSANSRRANRVVEICMSFNKSFFWYAQNLMAG